MLLEQGSAEASGRVIAIVLPHELPFFVVAALACILSGLPFHAVDVALPDASIEAALTALQPATIISSPQLLQRLTDGCACRGDDARGPHSAQCLVLGGALHTCTRTLLLPEVRAREHIGESMSLLHAEPLVHAGEL